MGTSLKITNKDTNSNEKGGSGVSDQTFSTNINNKIYILYRKTKFTQHASYTVIT